MASEANSFSLDKGDTFIVCINNLRYSMTIL